MRTGNPSAALTLLVLIYAAMPSHVALACDTFEGATKQSTCVTMYFEGAMGVWFTLGKADDLRTAYDLVPVLKTQIKSYDELVGDYKRQASNYAFVAEVRGGTIDDLQKVLAKETKRANDAELRANPWYTNPILWGIVGFAAGAVLVQFAR